MRPRTPRCRHGILLRRADRNVEGLVPSGSTLYVKYGREKNATDKGGAGARSWRSPHCTVPDVTLDVQSTQDHVGRDVAQVEDH